MSRATSATFPPATAPAIAVTRANRSVGRPRKAASRRSTRARPSDRHGLSRILADHVRARETGGIGSGRGGGGAPAGGSPPVPLRLLRRVASANVREDRANTDGVRAPSLSVHERGGAYGIGNAQGFHASRPPVIGGNGLLRPDRDRRSGRKTAQSLQSRRPPRGQWCLPAERGKNRRDRVWPRRTWACSGPRPVPSLSRVREPDGPSPVCYGGLTSRASPVRVRRLPYLFVKW
jgi:hypothetical protein